MAKRKYQYSGPNYVINLGTKEKPNSVQFFDGEIVEVDSNDAHVKNLIALGRLSDPPNEKEPKDKEPKSGSEVKPTGDK